MYATAGQPTAAAYQQYFNPSLYNAAVANQAYVPMTAPTPLPTPAFYASVTPASTPGTPGCLAAAVGQQQQQQQQSAIQTYDSYAAAAAVAAVTNAAPASAEIYR